MIIKKKIKLICILFFGLSSSLYSVSGTDPFFYSTLKNGFGIRPMSMGSAYSALGEEGSGISFNPAGLGAEGALMSWETMDTNKDNFQLNSAQSIYVSPFAVTQWKTKSISGEYLNVTAYGFGKKGKGRLDWGVVYKQLNRSGTVDAKGESMDFGLLLRVSERFSLSAVARDAYKKSVTIPTTGVVGWAYFNRDRSFIFTTDFVQNRFDAADPFVVVHVGTEWLLTKGFAVRGGAYEKTVTGGAGLIFPKFELDFGVVSSHEEMGPVTQYLFGVKFGKGVQSYAQRRQ